MTDKQNFEKDINVPSKEKIMYDYNAKDCEQCSSDSICCYCKNIACNKLEEQLKAKEQESEAYKMEAEEGKEINAELKAENEDLKEQNKRLDEVATHWHKSIFKVERSERKLKQTLAEIKEIAELKQKQSVFVGETVFEQILQKISEVEDVSSSS